MSSNFNLQPELSNELVKLISLTSNDFERLYAVASDPLIWEQHPSSDRYKREVFQKYFDGAVESNSAFLVFDNATGELIGSTRYYDYDPVQSKVAIGFTFLSCKYWGGIYNRAMKSLLLDHAFTFVDTVLFHIGFNNIRSQKATMKLGATKVDRDILDADGAIAPNYEYELKKADWMKTISDQPTHSL